MSSRKGELSIFRDTREGGAVHRRPRLADTVTKEIRDRILAGTVEPGEQLPTETQLITEFNVSRTVIREAIAGLQAQGFVEPRQGIGVFVSGRVPEAGLSFLSADMTRLASVLDVLELRLALEVEAAGLAAIRHTKDQAAAITRAFERMTNKIQQQQDSAGRDFKFHLAIVEATNNQFYIDVFKFLGERAIPRGVLASTELRDASYMRTVQIEHERILDAILGRKDDQARKEVRRHLANSRSRYRALAENTSQRNNRKKSA